MYCCVKFNYFGFLHENEKFYVVDFFFFFLDTKKLERGRKFQVLEFNGLNGWVGY